MLSLLYQQESPICSRLKKEAVQIAQLRSSMARNTVQLLGGPGARWPLLWPSPYSAEQLCSLPLYSALVCSTWTWQDIYGLSAPAGETVFSLQWNSKVCSESQRKDDLYRQTPPPLVPDCFVLRQMRTP